MVDFDKSDEHAPDEQPADRAFTSPGDTHADPDGGSELVRQQSWPAGGPAELDVRVDVGRISIRLDPAPAAQADGQDGGQDGEVRVEVRHDPSAGNSWTHGIQGLLSWLGNQTGGEQPADLAAEAVRATRISWSPNERRLVVSSPTELPLRAVPLAVTITAPAASRTSGRTGAGDIELTGRAGWAALRTGSGRTDVEAVDGDADVVTGSGRIELGPVSGRARVRTGSGEIRMDGVGARSEVRSGSGDVTVGEVAADLTVRTGSGDITISDGVSGRIDLTAGSGRLQLGVHPGVAAELDLTSGSGRVRSELTVDAAAPGRATGLSVHGRTGSGDVLVTRSAVGV